MIKVTIVTLSARGVVNSSQFRRLTVFVEAAALDPCQAPDCEMTGVVLLILATPSSCRVNTIGVNTNPRAAPADSTLPSHLVFIYTSTTLRTGIFTCLSRYFVYQNDSRQELDYYEGNSNNVDRPRSREPGPWSPGSCGLEATEPRLYTPRTTEDSGK